MLGLAKEVEIATAMESTKTINIIIGEKSGEGWNTRKYSLNDSFFIKWDIFFLKLQFVGLFVDFSVSNSFVDEEVL